MLVLLSVLGALEELSTVPTKYMLTRSGCIAAAASAGALFSVLLLCWMAWTVLVYPRLFSPLRALPEPPYGRLFTGHIRIVLGETSGFPQRQWTETVPDAGLITYRHFFQEMVLLTTTQTLIEVLVTKNNDFVKPKQLRSGLERILGIGLLLSEGEEHRTQRKNLMPAFSFRHIKDLYPVLWAKPRQLVHCLRKESSVKHSMHVGGGNRSNGIEVTE